MVQKALGEDAITAVRIKCGTNASKMAKNLVKGIRVVEGLQQAEYLRMSNVHGLQSIKISN